MRPGGGALLVKPASGGGGTPPSVRGKAFGSAGSPGVVTVAHSAFDVPPQAGDIVVAFMWVGGQEGVGAGWNSSNSDHSVPTNVAFTYRTFLSVDGPNSSSFALMLATRAVGGGEPDYTFTVFNGASDLALVECIAIQNTSGVNATVPTPNSLSAAGLNTITTIDAPGITTSADGCLLVSGWAAFLVTLESASWTAPAGMTELLDEEFEVFGLEQMNAAVGAKTITTAGASGAQTGTFSSILAQLALAASIAFAP